MSLAAGIRAGRAFVEIGANMLPLDAALARVKAKFAGLGATIARIGAGLAAATAGSAAALAWPLTLASNLQQSTAKFKTMLGSADAATKMLADIRQMAASTPFETSDLIGATETLLGFGVAADEIMGTLQALGDASGGNAQRFGQLALVFGQVSANGRLMGGDVLQMINAGFNPLVQIAERTGESMVDLRKRMEQGGISIEEVKQAFADATGPGGRFFGLMDEQSKTLAGRWSTLKDTIAEALIPLGEYILPIVETGILAVTGAVTNMSNVWQIGLSAINLAFMQAMAPIWDWVVAFQDVWTNVVTSIAQAGIIAFGAVSDAWQTVMNGIVEAIHTLLEWFRWLQNKVGQIMLHMSFDRDSANLLQQELEAQQNLNAQAKAQRQAEFAAKMADRRRLRDETIADIARQGEAEKRARQGTSGAMAEAQRKLKEAQDKFNESIGAAKREDQRRAQIAAKPTERAREATGGVLGAFNASLIAQQLQGGRDKQERIVKATEQTAISTKQIADNMGQGVEVG